MKILPTTWFSICLFFFACQQKNKNDLIPSITLDTLWSKELSTEIPMQLNSQGNLICYNKSNIYIVDANNGNVIQKWRDYTNSSSQLNYGYYLFIKDQLFISEPGSIVAVNTLTGKTAWRNLANLYNYTSGLGSNGSGKSYLGQSKQNYLLEIFEIDESNGEKTFLFNVFDSTLTFKQISIYDLQWGKNSQDQPCLFLQLYFHNFDGGLIRQFCYNLTEKQIAWENVIGISELKSTYTAQKLYLCNKLSLKGKYYVHCYSVDNGKLLWQQELGEERYEKFLVHDNNLIAIPTTGFDPIIAFNLQTGEEQWRYNLSFDKRDKFMFYGEGTSYHPPYLFSAYKKHLLIININTGEEVYFKSIGFSESAFYKGVAVNQNTRKLYLHDNGILRCYRLPKEVVF